jgi:hypothetical protein
VFFIAENHHAENHVSTTKPPQLHHKSPDKNTHFSQNPLKKTPIKQQNHPRHHARKKSVKKQV